MTLEIPMTRKLALTIAAFALFASAAVHANESAVAPFSPGSPDVAPAAVQVDEVAVAPLSAVAVHESEVAVPSFAPVAAHANEGAAAVCIACDSHGRW